MCLCVAQPSDNKLLRPSPTVKSFALQIIIHMCVYVYKKMCLIVIRVFEVFYCHYNQRGDIFSSTDAY